MGRRLVTVESVCEHVHASMAGVSADSWLRVACPWGCDAVVITTEDDDS